MYRFDQTLRLISLALSLIAFGAAPADARDGERSGQHATLLLGLPDAAPASGEREAIEDALARAIGSLTPLKDERDLDLMTALSLLGCSSLDAACTDALLDLFEASAVVIPELERSAGMLTLRVRHINPSRPDTSFDISTPLDRPVSTLDLQGRARSWLQGHATVEVRSWEDGPIVRLDRTVRGQTPLLLTGLQPGTHTITIEHDGAEAEQPITVDAAAHHDLRFARSDLARPSVATPRRTTAFILYASSAGATAGGIAFAAALRRTQDEFDTTFVERDAHDLASRGQRQALGANLLFATAIATAATGTVLLLLPPRPQEDRSTALQLRPSVSPHFVGASIELGR